MVRRIVMALALVLMLSVSACGGEPQQDDRVLMPASSSDFKGEEYQAVLDLLREAGFTNVDTKPLGNLITGWINKPETVDEVAVGGIGGTTTFSKDTDFEKDVKIVVAYHSFPEKGDEPTAPEPTQTETSSSVDEPTDEQSVEARRPEIADAVRTRWLAAFDIETELDLLPHYIEDPYTPTYAITKWEDDEPGWVRIHIQEDITTEEAQRAGRQVLGLTCEATPELGGVVVRGVDGIDHLVHRREVLLCEMASR